MAAKRNPNRSGSGNKRKCSGNLRTWAQKKGDKKRRKAHK